MRCLGIVVLLMVGVVGCQYKVEESADGDSVKIQIPGGIDIESSSGDGVEMPKDFPSDVYTPAGAKLMTKMNLGGNQQLVFEGKQVEIDALIEEIKSEMLDKGWKEESSVVSGDGGMLMLTKENRGATYGVSKNDDATQISLTLSQKQ